MLYIRHQLSRRNIEDLLAEWDTDASYETVRLWWNRFGPVFVAEFHRDQTKARQGSRESQ